jgi:four helix bundle protein
MMASFNNFEDIEAWQKARVLTRKIYSAANQSSFSRDFGLRDQIRRAAVSIMSNIAEGFERGGTKEFVQFLSIAKGSAGEVRSQLYVALEQGYIDDGAFENLFNLATETSRMIAGLMNYLKKSKIKGSKYK